MLCRAATRIRPAWYSDRAGRTAMGGLVELVDFLRARLDEDAELAAAASPGPWRPSEESDEVLAVDGITVADGFALSGRQLRATTDHIARHDPARVLAEVEAKRRLLLWAENAEGGYFLLPIVDTLVEVYRGHPDFDPVWLQD